MGGELTYIENTSKEDVDGLPDVTDKQRCKVPEAPFVKKVSKKKVREASISSPHTPKAKMTPMLNSSIPWGWRAMYDE